ncbi:MAG: hypothetical protein GY869_03605 [Planctomycetes bacterium]|nr:hypothetical protein [Planctomycetota bacterium]
MKWYDKSIVSDFRMKIKVICVCLLNLPAVFELYDLFLAGNKMKFPVMELGVAVWSLICLGYLSLMMVSDYLQKVSLKSDIVFLSIRKKIICLIGIFCVLTVISTVLFVRELKSRQEWQQATSNIENLLQQIKQENE